MHWLHTGFLACLLHLAAASEYLLPGDVVPSHYDVRYAFDVDPNTNFSFYGVVDILITVKKPTNKVVLHGKDFKIAEKLVIFKGPKELTASTATFSGTYDFLTVNADGLLNEGENYTMTIPFYGKLKSGLSGAYISTYVDQKTQVNEYLIATQFESIAARQAFPCFDEPLYKASYTITIGHHKDYTTISNMPLKDSSAVNVLEDHFPWSQIEKTFQKTQSDFVWDIFQTTIPMSTYLVAFVVSKFSYTESPKKLSDTQFRIWARKDALKQTIYASTTGPKTLSFFEQWFNVSFPLPKLDMIAIPDFESGAMENWGLITYREKKLLYDEKQTSFLRKEQIAEIVAHELAHQWFGNLVTMKWWSDLWLKEGFATFCATVAVNQVEPTWHTDRNSAVKYIMSVLDLDAFESSHPVSVHLDNPKRITEIYDVISYHKGCTLIRMMTMFLGDEIFKNGIHNYLIKYSYQNAEQDDLWRELTYVNQKYGIITRDVTVKEIMDTWTKQTGYPILTVTRNYEDKSVSISQKRYFLLPPKSESSITWWVPLTVLSERDATRRDKTEEQPLQWLAAGEGLEKQHSFHHGANVNEWLLFNYDMMAVCRVNYDKHNWQLLTYALNSNKYEAIPVMARVQLVSDALALAWTNDLDYFTALSLARYLEREQDLLPLSTGLNALAKIGDILKRTPDYEFFQQFVRKLIEKTYKKTGGLAQKRIINSKNLNSVKMQVSLSDWACQLKVAGCEENAIQLFQQWMKTSNPDDRNPIPLDLRSTVYCVAVSRGSVLHWKFALAREQRANVPGVKDELRQALTCSKDVWVLKQYLEMAVTEGSGVRVQDAVEVIRDILQNSVGYYFAKDFIYERIADIHKHLNPPRFQARSTHINRDFQDKEFKNMGNILKALLSQFTTQKELDEFFSWRENNTMYLEESKLAVKQGIEQARVNIQWMTNNRQTFIGTVQDLLQDDKAEIPKLKK